MFLVVPRLEYWLVTWIREIAELFNDFYEYDPVSYTWSNLTDLSQFSSVYPPPRKSHGFASSGTKLYVFGGQVSKSGNMELISLSVPSLTQYTSRHDIKRFIFLGPGISCVEQSFRFFTE